MTKSVFFTIKSKDKPDRTVEFEYLEELLAFIMGCDKPVLITPNWQSRAWVLEVKEHDKE